MGIGLKWPNNPNAISMGVILGINQKLHVNSMGIVFKLSSSPMLTLWQKGGNGPKIPMLTL
jgi:hypothetical protein